MVLVLRLFVSSRGLQPGASAAAIHGSLLAMGEMLRHTGEFMLARYREVVSTGERRCSRHADGVLRVTGRRTRVAHGLPRRDA